MAHPNRRTPLTGLVIDRIQQNGPMRFDEFMRDCLYHPQHGYYTSRVPKAGRRDFFTSPEVGPAFARLLAFQFAEMWERLGRPERFDLVECGAGDGRLASDLLACMKAKHTDCFTAVRYTLVESAAAQREQAAEHLAPFAEAAQCLPELPSQPVTGCIFTNELLDALPVQRVVRRGGHLRTILVGTRTGRKGRELAEVEGEHASPVECEYLGEYGAPLEEGQVAEVSLEALEWLELAAGRLDRGYLLTIDYGHRARELYGSGHLRGTLMAYRDHRAGEDWLGWPGLQDLTAHVNFTAVEERGRELGLQPLGFVTQTQFLMALARASGYLESLQGDPADRERIERVEQFKQLIHPGGMGEAFKVLVQGRGVSGEGLSGLEPL